MTAHLADESRLAGLPELAPTLIRWAPPAGAPPHLRVGIERLDRAGRDETLLVVSAEPAPAALLERIAGARKTGAAIFALDQGDPELDDLAHESLALRPTAAPISFDGAQHLVSLAIGETTGRRLAASPADVEAWQSGEWQQDQQRRGPRRLRVRSQLARILDAISGPAPD